MQKLTLITPFEVPAGQEEAFRQQWREGTERQMQAPNFLSAPGFLSVRLYEVDDELEAYLARELGFQWLKERPMSRAKFPFVHLAEWASVTHYEAALRLRQQGRAMSLTSFPAYYRLATEYSRPEQLKDMQPFTLIVPFEVPQGQESEIRRQFADIVASMGSDEKPVEGSFGPGLYEIDTEAEAYLRDFISTILREDSSARPKFPFVNVAEWASLTAYETAIRSVASTQTKPITFPSYPAYYRIVAEYTGSQRVGT